MKQEESPLPVEHCPMAPSSILEVVNQTYKRFLLGSAIKEASEKKEIKLANFLLRLQDFATVVEVNWATKAGNPGWLIFMWKQWAIMGQAFKKLVHYSHHLPQLIILLEVILPKSLASVVENTLLLCPSG